LTWGPKHVVKRGKTPVLTALEARELLGSIDTSSLVSPRDRALLDTMVNNFARVSERTWLGRLKGAVEADETYIGGYRPRHNDRDVGKTGVAIAVERRGATDLPGFLAVIPRATTAVLTAFVGDAIEPQETTVFTDARQFLMVAAGGRGWSQPGDALLAFSLPR
jgi:hypothetical protein